MNEDGEFVCDQHDCDAKYKADATELHLKCDHCNEEAKFYVLEEQPQ